MSFRARSASPGPVVGTGSLFQALGHSFQSDDRTACRFQLAAWCRCSSRPSTPAGDVSAQIEEALRSMTGLRSFSFSNVAPSPSSSPASDAPPPNLGSHLAPQAGPELISTTYINSVPQPPVRVPLTTSALSHMSLSPGQRRWDPSATPSATSISDGEESAEIDEYTARRINEGSPWVVSNSKGKGKERIPLGYRRNTIRSARDAGLDGTGLVNQLPPEILRHVRWICYESSQRAELTMH